MKSAWNVSVDPIVSYDHDHDYDEVEEIFFYFSNFDPIILKNFEIGTSVKKYGIHFYHDINPSSHMLSDHKTEYRNDPWSGEIYTAGEFLLTRISKKCIRVEKTA